MGFWKAIAVGSYLIGWLERASRDGTIDAHEVAELVSYLAAQLGFDVALPVPPTPNPERGETFGRSQL